MLNHPCAQEFKKSSAYRNCELKQAKFGSNGICHFEVDCDYWDHFKFPNTNKKDFSFSEVEQLKNCNGVLQKNQDPC